MKLKYAGPRPLISHHGVTFKEGKEDKYVYLVVAIEILKTIQNLHDGVKEFHYEDKTHSFSDDEMMMMVMAYHPDLEVVMNKEMEGFQKHLDHEVENLEHNHVLSKEELYVFKNNLDVMREYRIQRAKNKVFYFHVVATIAEIIKKEKIKKIVVPFNDRYWHVLQTLEGELAHTKPPAIAKLTTQNINGELKAIMVLERLYE